MEKRQLNFNAPLLSARRYSSPSKSSELVNRKVLEKPLPSRQQSLPLNKFGSEEPDEVTKPAAVPFHWEQIPGRPKGRESHTPDESSSNTPRLPPGRLSGPLSYNSGERSNDQNIYRPYVEAFSFSDHANLLEKLKDESDSESEDNAYSDALDMLSPTESCSLNYSVSGISGYHSSGVKPSGTFCVDAQTRDFMMSRFLPAAKAVVLETPQYVVKKPTALSGEQPMLVRKAVSGEMKSSFKQYDSSVLSYYNQLVDKLEIESSDEEESKVVVPVKKGKTWGILPKFCVKNSLCLLNPLPGMKSKSRAPSPSNINVRRLTRNAHSGPIDKNACLVPPKKKFHSGLLSRDLIGFENELTHDSNQYRSAGVSPMRRYRSGNISPYRNESPKSPFHEGVGFLGVPKQAENYDANKIASSRKLFKALQDVSTRNQTNGRGSSAPAGRAAADIEAAVEKTLYIDSVKKTSEDPKKLSPNVGPTTTLEDAKTNQNSVLECSDPPVKSSSLAPPLPKSPSESWLWRTLPSISNPFAHSRRSSSHVHSKKLGQKGDFTDAKWETIVKTTNVRHDHVRYLQELVIPHASHRQSKS